jgi:competence protein ComEC
MLAARRPLPRRWWLPLLASGLLCGAAAPHVLAVLGLALALGSPAVTRWSRRAGVAFALVGWGCVAGGVRSLAPWDHGAAAVAEVPLRYAGAVEESRAPASGSFGPAAEISLRLIDPPAASGLAAGARMRVAVWKGPLELEFGEIVELVARARTPRGLCNDGEDPYADAAWRRGIAAETSLSDARALSRRGRTGRWWDPAHLGGLWRARTGARIRATLSPTEAAIVRALVLGDQRDIAPDVRLAFTRTGTTHVLSVSGLHVAMVAAAVLVIAAGVAARLPRVAARTASRRAGAVAAMPAVGAYAWLTSPGAPILRAAVMAELYLAALALRRPFDFATALALAAIVAHAADPAALGDVSAQLSFLTVLWIWAGMRLLQRALRERRAGRPFAPGRRPWPTRIARAALAAVAASALATAGAAPILAWRFGEVSVVGLLANPIVVPVMGWGALGLGLTGMVLVPLSPLAASLAFQLAGLCVRLSVAVVTALADWPHAAVPLRWEPALLASATVALAALPAKTLGSRVARGAVGGAVACAVALAASPSSPALRASFLDVGQGDAALVEIGPATFRFLVDGGGLPRGRDPGERVLLPALRRRGIDRLDAGVVSHPEWDHFGGLDAVARAGRAGEFWWAGQRGESAAWRRFAASLEEGSIPLRVARADSAPPLARARGAIEVLHPGPGFAAASANDASLVLRVRYGAASLLFTGDIEARAEAWLLSSGARLAGSILKVPHHGSATSSGAPFVRAVRPVLAVASLGRGNAFRFPADAVRERYRGVGAEWTTTARSGEIAVESDGQLTRARRCRGAMRKGVFGPARW